jgi:hypothetical protein
MKRILLLVVGYYLLIQSALATLITCGQAENAVYILPIAALSGWAAYKLIDKAKAKPTPVLDTQPLPLPIADRDTKPLDKQS